MKLIMWGVLGFLFCLAARGEQVPDPEFFHKQVKPIFDARCVQCHSCYNAPCQFNLSSVEGLDRGLVKDFEVYSPRKLRAEEPSRLGVDRKTIQEWRNFSFEHKFKPVALDTGNAEKNLQSSLIYQLVRHKKKNPDFALNDFVNFKQEQAEYSRTCPENHFDLADHLAARPNAGMPYGLPPLAASEIEAIKKWTEMGSPRTRESTKPIAEDLAVMRKAESYLNAYLGTGNIEEAKKQSLVSRYLYEHLFLANITLQDIAKPQNYYRLIRSRTACNSPELDEVATRRPWESAEGTFYYCFKKIDQTITHKNHLFYAIDGKRLERWQDLFFSSPWQVSFAEKKGWLGGLIGGSKNHPADVAPRSNEEASNPMYVFRDIPVRARYQFLLDDAEYHVDTFIRGPVCKGNTAVNSIDEQFYVFFLNPESDLMVRNKEFYDQAVPLQVLPAYKGSEQIGGVGVGRKIREARNNYRILRDQFFGKEFPKGLGIEDIWNGQSEADQKYVAPNKNAALTVFRNFDSAAVTKGLVGATSKTILLLDYSIFERLVYNLVVGFDVYGDISHQVHTRLYMSYIKMEAEENFLSLLPPSVRLPMRKSWYVPANGISEKIANVVNTVLDRSKDKLSRKYPLLGVDKPSAFNLPALDENRFYSLDGNAQENVLRSYRRQLVKMLRTHIGPAVREVANLNGDKAFTESSSQVKIGAIQSFSDFERELEKLSDLRAMNAPWVLFMPGLSYVVVEGPGGAEIYTLLRNKEHFNVAWIAGETGRRNRAADNMTFYRGVLGSYPNHFFRISLKQAQGFLQRMNDVRDHASYESWIREYGSPRDGAGSERFWANSDRLHEVFRAKYPREYGVFDYNRYGVDYRFHKDGDEMDSVLEDLDGPFRETIIDAFGDEE